MSSFFEWAAEPVEVDEEFEKWYKAWEPDWESEYTGHIYAAWKAWEAGRNYERSHSST
jgi:hypothetical protein